VMLVFDSTRADRERPFRNGNMIRVKTIFQTGYRQQVSTMRSLAMYLGTSQSLARHSSYKKSSLAGRFFEATEINQAEATQG